MTDSQHVCQIMTDHNTGSISASVVDNRSSASVLAIYARALAA